MTPKQKNYLMSHLIPSSPCLAKSATLPSSQLTPHLLVRALRGARSVWQVCQALGTDLSCHLRWARGGEHEELAVGMSTS